MKFTGALRKQDLNEFVTADQNRGITNETKTSEFQEIVDSKENTKSDNSRDESSEKGFRHFVQQLRIFFDGFDNPAALYLGWPQ